MSASRSRGLVACLAFVVMGLALVGCSKPVPTESEIVGTWVSEGTDGWGEPGGSIAFSPDGTFTARGVPEGLLGGSREATPIGGEGTWVIDDGSFGNSPNYYDPGVRITFSPDPPAAHHSRLTFANSSGTLTLRYLHDPDTLDRYILVKQD